MSLFIYSSSAGGNLQVCDFRNQSQTSSEETPAAERPGETILCQQLHAGRKAITALHPLSCIFKQFVITSLWSSVLIYFLQCNVCLMHVFDLNNCLGPLCLSCWLSLFPLWTGSDAGDHSLPGHLPNGPGDDGHCYEGLHWGQTPDPPGPHSDVFGTPYHCSWCLGFFCVSFFRVVLSTLRREERCVPFSIHISTIFGWNDKQKKLRMDSLKLIPLYL